MLLRSVQGQKPKEIMVLIRKSTRLIDDMDFGKSLFNWYPKWTEHLKVLQLLKNIAKTVIQKKLFRTTIAYNLKANVLNFTWMEELNQLFRDFKILIQNAYKKSISFAVFQSSTLIFFGTFKWRNMGILLREYLE